MGAQSEQCARHGASYTVAPPATSGQRRARDPDADGDEGGNPKPKTAKRKLSDAEAESGPGVLFSSGLIAGASVIGTILAFLQLSEPTRNFLASINVSSKIPGFAGSDLVSLLLFLGLGAVLWAVATERLLGTRRA